MPGKILRCRNSLRETLRRFLVSLKRKPSSIALAVLLIAFLEYSLQLTVISKTTAVIQGAGMGLSGFITMLFSMLGMVCYANSFPHRKPVLKPMLALMFVMHAVVIYADIWYINAVKYAIYREIDPITVTEATSYITKSIGVLTWNVAILALGLLLTAAMPLYTPLIKRIKTSVAVEGNDSMGAIDISGD